MGHRTAVLTVDLKAEAASKSHVRHVVPEQCVFEAVNVRRLMPIAHNRMADLAVVEALGKPALLHARSTLAPIC